jgi:hypothetical protein
MAICSSRVDFYDLDDLQKDCWGLKADTRKAEPTVW